MSGSPMLEKSPLSFPSLDCRIPDGEADDGRQGDNTPALEFCCLSQKRCRTPYWWKGKNKKQQLAGFSRTTLRRFLRNHYAFTWASVCGIGTARPPGAPERQTI